MSYSIGTGDDFTNTNYPAKFIDRFMRSNLSHDYISPKLYSSVVDMRHFVLQKQNQWPPGLHLFFMQGGKDGSVGVEKNLAWAEGLSDLFPGLVQIGYHPELEHAMLRGTRGCVVVQEIIDFMESILSQRS